VVGALTRYWVPGRIRHRRRLVRPAWLHPVHPGPDGIGVVRQVALDPLEESQTWGVDMLGDQPRVDNLEGGVCALFAHDRPVNRQLS